MTSHIAEQRDALANWFLRRTEFTHLLMADSDMAWPADLPPRLLGDRRGSARLLA
jgi:hypothetical protein